MSVRQDVIDLWPDLKWERHNGSEKKVIADVGSLRVLVTRERDGWQSEVSYYDCVEDSHLILFSISGKKLTVVIRTTRARISAWCKSLSSALGMRLEFKHSVKVPRGVRPDLRDFCVDIEHQLRVNPFATSSRTPYSALSRISELSDDAKHDTFTVISHKNESVNRPKRILNLSVDERRSLGDSISPIVLEIAALAFHIDSMTRPWRKRVVERKKLA